MQFRQCLLQQSESHHDGQPKAVTARLIAMSCSCSLAVDSECPSLCRDANVSNPTEYFRCFINYRQSVRPKKKIILPT